MKVYVICSGVKNGKVEQEDDDSNGSSDEDDEEDEGSESSGDDVSSDGENSEVDASPHEPAKKRRKTVGIVV
jgi:hypothetical protein